MSAAASPIAESIVMQRGDGTAHPGARRAERAQRDVAALYSDCGGEFLSYALSLGRDEELARDALQEAFMRYFIALCDGQKIATPRAWIYRVIHNYVLDRMKEARHRLERRLQHQPAYTQDIEGQCFRRELLNKIRNSLTPREYDCLRLRTEGMRYEEIASTLALTSGTVGALLSRAIRKIRITVGVGGNGRK